MPARLAMAALAAFAIGAPVGLAVGDAELASSSLPVPAYGSYSWPVRGPVIRGFEAPAGPYGAGHRGIDIAAAPGATVRAANDGVVAFAGRVAGELHVSIDHPDGVRTSYAFLGSIRVRAGSDIARGEVLGTVGDGHPGSDASHLHLGARWGGEYIDPMLLLERGSLVGLIHLAPIEESGSVP